MFYVSIHEHKPSTFKTLDTCTLKFIHIQYHSTQQFLLFYSATLVDSPISYRFISMITFISIQPSFFHSTILYPFNNVNSFKSFHIHSAISAQQQILTTS